MPLTATRLHALLVAEGQRVGVMPVKAAVAEWRRRSDLAEVDFFEVLVDVDGTRRRAFEDAGCRAFGSA